jgi:hypothetical protein
MAKSLIHKQNPYRRVTILKNKLSESDLCLRLIDYTARYFSFSEDLCTLFGIIRDIFNCGVVVEKYFLYLGIFQKDKDISIGNFVSADLEFLFSNIRSAYDSLQCLISVVWYKEKKRQIPRRFSDMVKCDKSTMIKKYHLPNSLIACYQQSKDFFEICKTIRDNIHHSNVGVPAVFCLEDGFALGKDRFLSDPIAKIFDIWPSGKTKKNGLVSVLALYAHLNKSFLNDTESFSESLKESCPKVPMISTKYTLFLRGPYLQRLADSDKYLREQWITD